MEETLEKNRVLYNILYVVFKRKGRLTFLCGLSFGLIVFFTMLQTPTFEAVTKILVRPNPQQQLILFKNLATPGKENPAINPGRNLIQILTGQQMAREVVEKFELDKRVRSEADASGDSEGILDKVHSLIGSIKGLLGFEEEPGSYLSKAIERFIERSQDVQLEEESNVINLTIWEEEPELSSQIANFMARRLIERSSKLEQSNAEEIYEFTSQRIKSAEESLEQSEDQIFEFRKKHGVVSFGDQKRERLKDLIQVETQHRNIQAKLSEAQAKLDAMRKVIAVQRDLVRRAPVFANNEVIEELVRSLNSHEIRLSGALERFTLASQDVKELKAQTLENRQRIESELNALIGSDSAILQSIHPELANEYTKIVTNMAGMRSKEETLAEQMSQLRSEVLAMAELEKELKSLNTLRAAKDKLYTNLLGKYTQLEVQKALEMSAYDLKIIDEAYVPEDAQPDRPNWSFILPLGLIGSFFLGFGIVFFSEYWEESFKSPQDVEDKLDLEVLCTVPDMS